MAITISPNWHTYGVPNKLNMVGANEVFYLSILKVENDYNRCAYYHIVEILF